MATAEAAILAQLQPLGGLLPVFERVVVPPPALGAGHHYHHAVLFFRHSLYPGGRGAPDIKKRDFRPVPGSENTTDGRSGQGGAWPFRACPLSAEPAPRGPPSELSWELPGIRSPAAVVGCDGGTVHERPVHGAYGRRVFAVDGSGWARYASRNREELAADRIFTAVHRGRLHHYRVR
jgi:hypothetical protein